jgi:hypothetical protein
MNPSSRAEAKVNLAFSVRIFGVLAQNAARQDGGDFGGAFGGGELVGWDECKSLHDGSTALGLSPIISPFARMEW